MSKMAIYRPGALGDIVMIMNTIKQLKQRYETICLFCHSSSKPILGDFIMSTGLVDRVIDMSEFDPNAYDHTWNAIGYPLKDNYPHVPLKNHLVHYFSEEVGVDAHFDDLSAPMPRRIVPFDRYITIQVKTGWSRYKDWPYWDDFVKCMTVNVVQIGGPEDPLIPGVDFSLLGHSFMENLSAQAWAAAHVGQDSIFNHTTNILWNNSRRTPAVILFGSTSPAGSGYETNTNISLNLPCQPCYREDPTLTVSPIDPPICPNPLGQTAEDPRHACLYGLPVNVVVDATKRILMKDHIIRP